VSLFYLFSVESKFSAELEGGGKSPRSPKLGLSPWNALQSDLIITLMKQVNGKSESAFRTVQHLIDQCLNSKQKLDLLEDVNDDLIP